MSLEALQRARRHDLLLLLLPLALLAAHALSYLPFFADDALISLRYAHRFLEGQGLTWTDGERVEGYTNLLWVLLVSFLGWLRIDLILSARLLGLFFSFLTLITVFLAGGDLRHRRPGLSVFPALMLALCGPVAAWAVGGLETSLEAALLGAALVSCYPLAEGRPVRPGRVAWAGSLLGLLCLTRADSLVLVGAAVAGLVLARRFVQAGKSPSKAWVLWLLVPVAICVLGQELFRISYYGDWVPNTARAKFTPSPHLLRVGLAHVARGLFALSGLVLASTAAAGLAWRRTEGRPRMVFLLLPLLAWCGHVSLIGGDIFPARRHMVVVALLAALLLAEGLRGVDLLGKGGARRAGRLLVGCCVVLFFAQSLDGENLRARAERWEWDGRAVGLLLKKAFAAKRPLVAVDPAGCVPYFSELPCLDMLGLNDRFISRTRPPGRETGRLGHLLGDGPYVFRRNPDLILFSQPAGGPPDYPTGRMMVADPRFPRIYREVAIETSGPRPFLFRINMKREGGAVGIERGVDRSSRYVVVPGYLFADRPGSVARLARTASAASQDGGELGMGIAPGQPACLCALALEPAKWTVKVRTDRGSAHIRLRSSGEGTAGWEGVDSLTFLLVSREPAAGEDGAMPKIEMEVTPEPMLSDPTVAPSGGGAEAVLLDAVFRTAD